MAAVFNRAGYATMRTCKASNSYDAADKQFAVRKTADKRGGNDAEGSAWHAEQVLDYLEQRENCARRSSLSDFLRLLSPARHARRQARVAGQVRRGQSYGQDFAAAREPQPAASCRSTICRASRFRTVSRGCATRSR